MKFSKIATGRPQMEGAERCVAKERKPSVERMSTGVNVTYLSPYKGNVLRLLKCPLCNFHNIYEDTINHHIQYTHFLDPYRLVKTRSTASTPERFVSSQDKENLSLLWIRCLFCPYKDKIEWDLAQHIFERHRSKLVALPIYSKDRKDTKALSGDMYARFEAAIEFRLDVAVEMAREENRSKGIRHAIMSLQNKIVQRHIKRGKKSITIIASSVELDRKSWRLGKLPEINSKQEEETSV